MTGAGLVPLAVNVEISKPVGYVVVIPFVPCECTCHGLGDHCEWCCNNDRDGYCSECIRGDAS